MNKSCRKDRREELIGEENMESGITMLRSHIEEAKSVTRQEEER